MTSFFAHRRVRPLAIAILATFASLLTPVPSHAQATGSDLIVDMVDAPDPVGPGRLLTYRITIDARGNRAASTVTVQTSVPAGTTFESFSGPPGFTYATPPHGGGGTATASVDSFPTGRRAILQFSVRVAADLPEGSQISNSVTVASSTTDPTPANNTAATSTRVQTPPPPRADLAVNIDFLRDQVPAFGQLVTMVIVRNQGPMLATDVEIRSPTPQGTVFLSAYSSQGDVTGPAEGATGDVRCVVDTIPNDKVVVLTIVMRVTAPVGARLDTIGGASASSEDPDTRNNGARATARVVEAGPVADVAIAFTNPPERVTTDSLLTYVVEIHNDGPTLAEGVVALVPVPRIARFVSATAERGMLRTPPPGRMGPVGWSPETLTPGESLSLTVTVRVGGRTGVPLVATALVASNATDGMLSNNAALASTRVQTLGDAVLQWDPPDPDSGGNTPPLNVVVDPNASSGAAAKGAVATDATRSDSPPICYNVYVSEEENVQTTPENLFTSVPANQTTTTVPIAPSGSFFTVTAEYPDGESPASNSDGAGDQPGAALTSMKVAGEKITAKGSGFTDTVEILLDGIPFRDPAKVKAGNSKAIQKGSLVVDMTVEQYMATGTEFLIIVRNSDGGFSVWEYEK